MDAEMKSVEEVIPADQRELILNQLAGEETALALTLVRLLDGVNNNPEILEKEETRALKKALAALPIDPNSTTLTTEQLDLLCSLKSQYRTQGADPTQ